MMTIARYNGMAQPVLMEVKETRVSMNRHILFILKGAVVTLGTVSDVVVFALYIPLAMHRH
jgi:hypothetical protein